MRPALRSAAAALLILAGRLDLSAVAAGDGSARSAGETTPAKGSIEDIKRLRDEGRLQQAADLARRLLAEAEASHGVDSLEAAEVIDQLVSSLVRLSRANGPDTRSLAERAWLIKDRGLPPAHYGRAPSLHNLANLSYMAGDYPAALKGYRAVLPLREARFGPENGEVAAILNNLANAHQALGDYAAARPLRERVLAIWEHLYGPDHPDVGVALDNLGNLLADTGEYDEARRVYERSLILREKALGPMDPEVARTLQNLALVHSEMGDYAVARPLYERALVIFRAAAGPENQETLIVSANFADLLSASGDYAAARPLLESTLSAAERVNGPNHPDVGDILLKLGTLGARMGDHAGARRMFERAVAILEESLGSDHDKVAIALTSVASQFWSSGQAEEAGRLFERAQRILEAALGSDHPAIAIPLTDRALALAAERRFAEARTLLERAIRIREAALGPEHPDLAVSLAALGSILIDMGDALGSIQLHERALAIRRSALGDDHPDVGKSVAGLATAALRIGDSPRALELGLRAESLAREHFRVTARGLSEGEALQYEAIRASGLNVALSALRSGDSASGGAREARAVWDAVVRSRAMVMDEMASRHRAVLGSEAGEVQALRSTLASARARLAHLLLRGPGGSGARRFKDLLEETRVVRERAERALAERSLAFRQEQARERIGLDEAVGALPRGSALVAYVHYLREHTTRAPPGRPEAGARPSAAYAAFIITSGSQEPSIVPLGDGERIDRLVREWQAEVSSRPRGPRAAARAEERYRRAAEPLRKAIWEPVAARVGRVRRLFVVPDGAINLVNFATFPAPGGRYLVETGSPIHYLSTERDLVTDAGRAKGQGRLLALGGPDYQASPDPQREGDPVAGAQAPPGVASGAVGTTRLFRGQRSACEDFQAMHFRPLPAARLEAETIASLWATAGSAAEDVRETTLLTGAAAAEAAVKILAADHSVLHLATHGFILTGVCATSLDGESAATRDFHAATDGPAAGEENPLILAGLALAGANRRDSENVDHEQEDGVLTAEEIASLDLSGVEWAVLSACETGVGQVRAGEGVLGLRRAFQIAGAGTLITSLWAVEDTAAARWMKRLYEARLEGRATIEALQLASQGVLEASRRAGRSTHPFFWGAFVAAGDWR